MNGIVSNKGNRVLYLDICKALAIFFVILGDVAILYDERGIYTPLSTFLHSFHTAFFMFISGYFFSKALKKDIKTLIMVNSRRLLIPYVSWSIICLFLVTIPYNGIENYSTTITHFLKGGILHEYWYIKCLFAYLFVTYLFVKIVKNELAGCLISFLFFTFMPSVFNTALFIPYFIAGHLCKSIINKGVSWRLVGILLLIVVVLYFYWDPSYNYNTGQSMSFVPYIVRTSIGCFTSLLLILLLKKIIIGKAKFSHILGDIGTYTLGIYCCREIFYSGYIAIILKNYNLGNSNAFYIVMSCVVLFMSYSLCLAINKNKVMSFLLLGNKLNMTK